MNAKVKNYLKIALIALGTIAAANRIPAVSKHLYGK